MSTSPPVLKVDVAQIGETCVVRVGGELDIATAPALESNLLHAMDSEAASVVLDLERVTFIDSMGLRVLIWAANASREDGDRLRIDCGVGAVGRMIELTGVEHLLPLTD
jgi:anti-sigma B factor antagonist